MEYLKNPWRDLGLPQTDDLMAGAVVDDPSLVMQLLAFCPAYQPTPLVSAPSLAAQLDIEMLHVKDERGRMALGSFKALGAAFAIAKQACAVAGDGLKDPKLAQKALSGQTFVSASAGNHGLSVAAGARLFGAQAVIYLAKTVPASFADLLRKFDAKVIIEGANYEASMAAALSAATINGWTLLSDSTWGGCLTGQDVMEGYLAMAAEITAELNTPPTHIFLQAGVGGLAAALTAYFRKHWGDVPQIIIVEPQSAPALQDCIRAGKFVISSGPTSDMGRLDCKEASHLALKSLANLADGFMTLPDGYVTESIVQLAAQDLQTSSSGGAGYAGLCAALSGKIAGLSNTSRALIILSEGPSDA